MTNTDKYYTKEEWASYMRNWRKKNKDKVKLSNQKQRDCRKIYKRKYYKNNKQKVIDSRVAANRKRLSGFTKEYYNGKYVEQQGYCAICGKHESEFNRALSADHNHVTGKPRGLLCGVCNTQLGKVEKVLNKDNSIQKFLDYLKDYPM